MKRYDSKRHENRSLPGRGKKVLLIHGTGRSKRDMYELGNRLERQGYKVEYGSYSEFKPWTKQKLVIRANTGGYSHVIGHSQGGFLAKLNINPRVRKISINGPFNPDVRSDRDWLSFSRLPGSRKSNVSGRHTMNDYSEQWWSEIERRL